MPREERKVVSVVFADLVGFTARSERLNPEDVRSLLADYHAQLRVELERFGGTVEKFIGDAVMAVFGAPCRTRGRSGAGRSRGASDPRLGGQAGRCQDSGLKSRVVKPAGMLEGDGRRRHRLGVLLTW